MEAVADGWRAWRLHCDDEGPSGYEAPLKGRAGAANAAQNPYSDRSRGDWEYAIVYSALVDTQKEPNHMPEPTPTSVTPAAEQPSRRP
jgi:hypothetical protein